MSVDSMDTFSEQLQSLPLKTPPDGLFADVKKRIHKRRVIRQQAISFVVFTMVAAPTIWILVGQQSVHQDTMEVALEVQIPSVENVQQPGTISMVDMNPLEPVVPDLTPTEIIVWVAEIDQELSQLPDDPSNPRVSDLEVTRDALKQSYLDIRTHQQQSLIQKVSNIH